MDSNSPCCCDMNVHEKAAAAAAAVAAAMAPTAHKMKITTHSDRTAPFQS